MLVRKGNDPKYFGSQILLVRKGNDPKYFCSQILLVRKGNDPKYFGSQILLVRKGNDPKYFGSQILLVRKGNDPKYFGCQKFRRKYSLKFIPPEYFTAENRKFAEMFSSEIFSAEIMYSKAFNFDFSTCVVKQIMREYYQTYFWLHSATRENVYLDPFDYGYVHWTIMRNLYLILVLLNTPPPPENFPITCTCMKCSREYVCLCRAKLILCCQHFKCNINSTYKNPYN